MARAAATGGRRRGRRPTTPFGFYGAIALVVVLGVAVVGYSRYQRGHKATSAHAQVPASKLGPLGTLGPLEAAPSPGRPGPEGVPVPEAKVLAPPGSPAPGHGVDGISCQASEQTVFHVHTHLTIFVDGHPRRVPYGVGIAPPRQVSRTPQGAFVNNGACFSWLHTHAADGVIHVESPVQRTFTLGDFFAIWGQPLGLDRVGPARGKVTAFFNGRHYLGNPADIPIGNHVQVQLDVGQPLVAPEHIEFPASL